MKEKGIKWGFLCSISLIVGVIIFSQQMVDIFLLICDGPDGDEALFDCEWGGIRFVLFNLFPLRSRFRCL